MKVAILGAGGVALGYAAFLTEHGHHPVVWSPSGAGTRELAGRRLSVSGILDGEYDIPVAPGIAEAIADAAAVVVALPGNGHRAVIDAALPHLRDGQTVIVSAQLSFSASYCAERLGQLGIAAPVVAWATTALLGRRTGAQAVTIGGLRSMLEMAVLPKVAAIPSLALCKSLFGERFRLVGDGLAIALSNLNPPIHMASALCNLTRIEKAEAWGNYDGITPAVARLIEALDEERLALAERCGVTVRSAEEHYRLTFGFAPGLSIAEMAAAVHERRKGPPGPTSLDTRFVTEDVPFGIVPLIELGRRLGMDLPLHAAGARLLSALYGRDLAADNDLLPLVDLAGVLSGIPLEDIGCSRPVKSSAA